MQVSAIKTTPNWRLTDNKTLGIQNYDAHNDYPQRVYEIGNGSGTIRNCLSIYTRFLRGKGCGSLADMEVGDDKLGQVFRLVAGDYARFGGFALHVLYNALGQVAGIEHVPFEYCRLCIEDDDGKVRQIAVNRDWTGRKQSPSKSNTTYVNVYAPEAAAEEIADTEGGVSEYGGQIMYVGGESGRNVYPSCLYEAELTDGATQIACANIRYRNAKNGFMPFGIVAYRKTKDYNADNESGHSVDTVLQDLERLQGDVNTGKIIAFGLEPGDELPEFRKMDGENYDGAFSSTENSTKANIGEAFMQPPVLRCQEVSQGFADDVMLQAYQFYNSVTEDDRACIENNFRDILSRWCYPVNVDSFIITPLNYQSGTHQGQ